MAPVQERKFLRWFRRHCTVAPESPNDAHRPRDRSMDLEAVLCIQHWRRVTNDYTIRFHNSLYQTCLSWSLARKRLYGPAPDQPWRKSYKLITGYLCLPLTPDSAATGRHC